MKYIVLFIWGTAALLYLKYGLEFISKGTRGGKALKKNNKLFVLFGIAAELAISVWVFYGTLVGNDVHTIIMFFILIVVENVVLAQFK